MQVARETSFEDLQKLLLKEMESVVHHQVLCQKQEVMNRLLLKLVRYSARELTESHFVRRLRCLISE